MTAEAASLGDHNPQGVAGVNTCGEKAPEIVVKGAGGAIFTRFYPNWSKLLDGEKQSFFDERERLNIKVGGKRKYFDKKNRAGMHPSSPKKKADQEIQRNISSLKFKCKELEENIITSEETDEHQDNVGDHFGGRKGKKHQKRSG